MTFKIKMFQSKTKKWKWNKARQFSMRYNKIWRHIFFIKKILKYFNDFQTRNFSVLWLNGAQARKMKQNCTFSHKIYSNMTSHFFINKCQSTSETFNQSSTDIWPKWTQAMCIIFPWETFKSDAIFLFIKNYQSITQKVKMKQNHTFFQGIYSCLMS